jgi:hypothetical protein
VVNSLGRVRPGSESARLFAATNAWIESGSTHMPSTVHAAVERRLLWQRPRAIVSAILAVVFLLVSVRVWRNLIERRRRSRVGIRPRERVLVMIGAGTVVATLLFTVVAVSNVRGSSTRCR